MKEPKEWWTNDIKNWQSISPDTAKLMLDQSEKLLIETIESAKIISAKTTQLVAFLIPLSTLLAGYLIQNWIRNGFDYLSITANLCLLCLAVSAYYCYKNFRPYKIAITGEYPHDIVTSKYIDNSFTKDEQYLNLLLNVCDNIENRILVNDDFNTDSIRNNRIAIKALFIIPFCPLLGYLLSLLFFALHCGL